MKKLYLSLVFLSATQAVFSLPQGPVTGADVAISHDQDKMVIHQTGDRSIINWSSFNIGEKELVQFSQPNASSAVLNRDLGGLPSNIMGSLIANGQVYLINQSGIIFGENAIVNAAAFFASTLDVLNDRFMQGDNLLFEGDNVGEIVHLGKISAELGDVVLIGRQIRSDGVIEAKNGTIGMATGVEVLVQPKMGEKIFIRAAREMVQEEGTAIDVKGALTALQVELKADGNLYQMGIKNAAHVEAMRSVERDGKIFLVAENGRVDVGGDLVASGGEIRVLGEYVRLLEDGFINVSSEAKGGTVLFGGDFQGKNAELMNAKGAWVVKGAEIKADALENGNGGKVVIWSDIFTRYYGNITAHGGDSGGNGGNVEVSGKMYLDYAGLVNTLAPMGKGGTLLLDPVNVMISANTTSANESEIATVWTVTACPPPLANIKNTDLGTSWSTNSSTFVQTFSNVPDCGEPGNLLIAADVFPAFGATMNQLFLEAANDIYVAANVTNPTTIADAGTGSILLEAVNNIYVGSSAPGVPATQVVIVGNAQGQTALSADFGDIHIGDPAATHASQVGWGLVNPSPGMSLFGQIQIEASTGSVIINGGSGANRAYAQVGHGQINSTAGVPTVLEGVGTAPIPSIPATIQIIAGRNISVLGGQNGLENYAQIGHGGIDVDINTNPLAPLEPITLDCPGTITIQGGQGSVNDLLCYAQVGFLGGSDLAAFGGGQTGTDQFTQADILIGHTTPPSGVVVSGGTSTRSWAHIGHGGDNFAIAGDALGNDVMGEINITTSPIGGGVAVTGGAGVAAWAQIGHGGGGQLTNTVGGTSSTNTFSGNVLGDIVITAQPGGAAGNIMVTGGQSMTPVALQGAYAQIGHGGLGCVVGDSPIMTGGGQGFGTTAGTINIHTPGTVNAVAGNGFANYAQIGHGGALNALDTIGNFAGPPALNSNIFVIVGAGVGVAGTSGPVGGLDDGTGSYGQIGHGGGGFTPSGNVAPGNLQPTSGQVTGGISVTVTATPVAQPLSVTVAGATLSPPLLSKNAVGQIGHGGAFMVLSSPTPMYQLNGQIDVTGNLNIFLDAGLDQSLGGAWIGHGSVAASNTHSMTVTGLVSVETTVNGAVILLGGMAGSTNATAVIGNGNGLPNPHVTFSGFTEVTPLIGNVTLTGGAGTGGQALVVCPSLTDSLAIQTLSGTISLVGGSGLNAHAGTIASGTGQIIEGTNVFVQGGSGGHTSFGFIDSTLSTTTTNITASGGDIVFFNGTSATLNPAMLNSMVFPVVSSGAGINLNAKGDVVLANTVDVSGSGTISILADSTVFGNGAFKVDTSTHTPAGVQIAPGTNGILLTSVTGMISISGAPILNGYSNAPADFQIGNVTDLSLIGSGLMPAGISSGSGNITIDAYRNVFITSSISGVIAGAATNGTLEIIANNNMQFLGGGIFPAGVAGIAGVTLVCDNQAPTSPAIGPGMFTMATGTFIHSNVAPIRVFTATRPQNSVLGTFDGISFVPGPLFVNSATEQWGCYFMTPCASTGGTPFTIFYKNTGTPGPGPGPGPGPTPSTLTTSTVIAQTVLSSALFFSTQSTSYLYWELVFDIGYDRHPYLTATDDMHQVKSFMKYLRPFEKSGVFEGLLPGLAEQKAMTSYNIISDHQLTLPPLWKADSKQYPSVIY